MNKKKDISLLYYFISLTGLVLWMLSFTKYRDLSYNPFLWTFSGMLFITPMFVLGRNSEDRINNILSKYIPLIASVLFLIASYVIFNSVYDLLSNHPNYRTGSDVIPSLETYVKRFLGGEKVYVEIPYANYFIKPTYFPGMWMPYIIPELIGFDYRYMALGSFLVVYFGTGIYYLKKNPSLIQTFVIAILPVLFLLWLVHYDKSAILYSTELMPLVFYMLLILGLTQKKWLLIGISIGLCTMSRYSYSLFIIPFIFIIWKEWGFKNLFKIGVSGLSVIILIYILPFFIHEPAILTNGFEYYSQTISDQWRVQSWQPENSIPYHLNNGLSFSYYFYTLIEGDLDKKLDFAKIFNLVASLVTAIGIALVWLKFKNKERWNIYLVNGLILYLIVFYSFLYVPFSYLFILPLGLGLTAFCINGHRSLKI